MLEIMDRFISAVTQISRLYIAVAVTVSIVMVIVAFGGFGGTLQFSEQMEDIQAQRVAMEAEQMALMKDAMADARNEQAARREEYLTAREEALMAQQQYEDLQGTAPDPTAEVWSGEQ